MPQNRESPSSRFTLNPAVAVFVAEPSSIEARNQALRSVFGEAIFLPQEGLGQGEAIPGGLGRGGSGPAVVYQWALSNPVAIGVASAATWDLTKIAGRAMVSLVRRAGGVLISRGAAALIAADQVAGLERESDSFLLEAVEEPTSIAGVRPPETNYVGIEPWIVFLVDLKGGVRYVVAVSSGGEVLGHMKIPLQETEADYYPGQPQP